MKKSLLLFILCAISQVISAQTYLYDVVAEVDNDGNKFPTDAEPIYITFSEARTIAYYSTADGYNKAIGNFRHEKTNKNGERVYRCNGMVSINLGDCQYMFADKTFKYIRIMTYYIDTPKFGYILNRR